MHLTANPRPVLIAALALLLALASPGFAQWAGFSDTSTALQTDTFSFIGTNPAAGDSNENYYDGDMADFDGDGWMDRALIARYGLLFNTGGGFMTPAGNTITGSTYRFGDKDGVGNDCTQWADVDNDGDLDILQGGNGETLVLQINSAGRFSGKPIPTISALQIVNTDLEKDGDVDLIIAHSFCSDVNCGHGCPDGNCGGTWPKTFAIYRNDGTGTFTNVTTASGFPSTWGEKLIVGIVSGDVDGDGDFDFLMINGIDRCITLARNNGAGFFTLTNMPFGVALAAIRPISSGFSQGMNLGDIDGDGDLDLVCALVRDTAGSPHPLVAHAVFINNGTGSFVEETATRFTVSGTTFLAGGNGKLADADYDGDFDFFAFNGDTKHFQLFLNDGTGRFTFNTAQSRFFTGGSVNGTGADTDMTDLNRDGAYDVWIGAAGSDPRTLLNTFQSPDGLPANVPLSFKTTAADANGVTLSWQHPPYADVARWYKVYRSTAPELDRNDRRLLKRVALSRHQDEGFAAPLTRFTTTVALGDPDVALVGADNEVQFIDRTAVPGVTYFYSVAHVGTENINSVPTAEVAAGVPAVAAADSTPPELEIVSPTMQDQTPFTRIVLHYGDGGSGIDLASLRVSFNRAVGGRAAGADFSDLFFRKDSRAFVAALTGTFTLPVNLLTTMTATIADTAGNVRTRTVQVFPTVPVPAAPAAAVASSVTGLGPLTVDFNASASTSSGTKITRWEWYFGDGTTALGRTFQKDFPAGGTWPVTLLVRDLRGGASTVATSITVAELRFLTIEMNAASFSGSVPTVTGRNYTLERSASLIAPDWAPLSRLPGDGTIRTFTDPAATGPQQFYRVRLVDP